MFAARVTLPHFSVTKAVSLPKSASYPGNDSLPGTANQRCVLESAPEHEIAARRDARRTACEDAHEGLGSVGGDHPGDEIVIVQVAAEFASGWWIECPVHLHSSSRDSAAAGARRRSAVLNPLIAGG